MRKEIPAPAKAVRAKSAAKPRQPRKKKTKITPSQREEGEECEVSKHWRTYFLQHLAETSNVTLSAALSKIAASRAYKVRREDPAFAAKWRAALFEGYEHLEMEAVGWLRNPDPERKFDIANAIRLLAAHRATIAQQRALTDDRDEQEVLDSIDAMIDEIRERSAANAALLAEDDREEPDAER